MEDNYDDDDEGEDVPITTNDNNNNAANTVANKQPTVPTVEMKKLCNRRRRSGEALPIKWAMFSSIIIRR